MCRCSKAEKAIFQDLPIANQGVSMGHHVGVDVSIHRFFDQ